MKRFLSFLLTLVLVSALCAPALAKDVKRGDTVTFDIYFHNIFGTAVAGGVIIFYDKDTFDVVSLKTDNVSGELWEPDLTGSWPSITGVDKALLSLGSGHRATLTLRIKPNAPLGKHIVWGATIGQDYYKKDVPVSASISNGHIITVASNYKTVVTEAQSNNMMNTLDYSDKKNEIDLISQNYSVDFETKKEENVQSNDINGDGTVDGRDSIYLIKYLAEQDSDMNNTDAENENTELDGRDALRLLKTLSE